MGRKSRTSPGGSEPVRAQGSHSEGPTRQAGNGAPAGDRLGDEARRRSPETPASWPGWARVVVTGVLIFHICAVVAGALGVPPSSVLERRFADLFTPYHDLVDQGYAYRYYAEPPPTPVILATLRFGDDRPVETVRLPGRSLPGPRMRHQRQLALAHALYTDFQEARQTTGDGSRSLLGLAYSRHLCQTHPGCQSVTLHAQEHLIPDPEFVRETLEAPGNPRFDLFGAELFTTPQWIGDYPCDGS